jgi:hypothetical protein
VTARAGVAMAIAGSLVAGWLAVPPPAEARTSGGGADVISGVAGGGSNPSPASGVPASSVMLADPVIAVYDSHGNVVFADQNNNVVRVVAATNGTFYGVAMTAGDIYTVVGNGIAGYSGDGQCSGGHCTPLTGPQVELSGPMGVAVDGAGDIAITDSGNSAVRFVAATTSTHFGINMTAGGIYTVATPDGTLAPVEQDSAAALLSPDGIAFDAQGDLVVADTGNEVVRVIANTTHVAYGQDLAPGTIFDIAGNGNQGFSGNGGPGTSAMMSLEPITGIAVDASGNVAFPDADNGVIRMVAASTGSYHGRAVQAGDIYDIAGNGKAAFGGDGNAALSAAVNAPQGVAYDATGDLYIGDTLNNRIRIVAAAKGVVNGKKVIAGDIYSFAGNGSTGAGGDGKAATSAALNSPAGVAVGPGGQVLIDDEGNNVLRQVLPPGPMALRIHPSAGIYTGGQKVVIHGKNLSGVTSVMFGSQMATSFISKSAKKVIAYTPASVPGRVAVRVNTGGGTTAVSASDFYTYTATPVHKRADGAKAANLAGAVNDVASTSGAMTAGPGADVQPSGGQATTATHRRGTRTHVARRHATHRRATHQRGAARTR